MNDEYLIGWVCPRCGASNAPWISRCDCKPVVSIASQWPAGTGTPLPQQPIITSGSTFDWDAAMTKIITAHGGCWFGSDGRNED